MITDTLENIISQKFAGEKETIDLEIDSPFHNFYANDICVSNSHAVSYSYLAMQTLYLKHYYPTEFYTALLNHPKANGRKDEKIKWLSSSISAAMSKGIKVLAPSRKSGWNWKMTGEKEISMGFSGVNGFGEKAYAELLDFVQKTGKTLDKMLITEFFELPFSAFDKKGFQVLVKSGVFDDWSDSRDFLYSLREKKRQKKIANQLALFDMHDQTEETNQIINKNHSKTTEEEKTRDFFEVCNFDMHKIEKYTKIREEINKRSKFYIDNIMNFENSGWYFFIVDKIEELISRNNNKYLNIKIGDGVNHTSVKAFGRDVEKMKKLLEVNKVYVTKFEKTDSGFLNFQKNTPLKRLEFVDNIM